MIPLHQKPIADFTLNELSRYNTFRKSKRADIVYQGQKFGIGFWETVLEDGRKFPFLALTVWTPDGWRVLDVMSPLWDLNDLSMDTGEPKKDLSTYMWWIAENFNPVIKAYFEEIGMVEEATGVEDADGDGEIAEWEKVVELLNRNPKIVDGFLILGGEL